MCISFLIPLLINIWIHVCMSGFLDFFLLLHADAMRPPWGYFTAFYWSTWQDTQPMQASCRLQTACKCRKSQQKKYNDNPLAGVKTVNVNFVLFSNFNSTPHIIFLFFFLFQIFHNAHFWQFILAFIEDNWDAKKQAAGQTDMMFRKGSWNQTGNVVKHIHQAYWPMCPGSGECGRGRVGEVLVRMRLFRLLVLQLQT